MKRKVNWIPFAVLGAVIGISLGRSAKKNRKGSHVLKPSVIAAWKQWNVKNESWTTFPYADSIGYITFGMGNLINSPTAMAKYDWRNPDGTKTSYSDIVSAWHAVKNAYPAVQSLNCASLTKIRVTDAEIQRAVDLTIVSAETDLLKSFPGLLDMPADEQAALLSHAWAMGGAFVPVKGFFKYAELVNAGQYVDAIVEGHYKGGGTQERQAQEKIAQQNAQIVRDQNLDPDILYWPQDLTKNNPVAAVAATDGGGYFDPNA
jgi:GH24 family phage-related lysozyme (muramidase)